MDPSITNWTTTESEAFKNALAEVDLNSSNWFEHLTTKFPNKTLEQLRDHYLDLIVDIEMIKSGQLRNPIHTDPWAAEMATEKEDLLVMDLPYSPGFSGTGSMCSGARSMSVPEKKLEEEDLSPPKETMLSEETIREGSYFTIDEGLMEESSNEVVEQEVLVPNIEEGWEVLLPEMTEEKNEVLSQETAGMKMVEDLLLETEEIEVVLPEAISEAQHEKRALREVTGVAERKTLPEDLGMSAPTKGKLWTEDEHRLFLAGLNIHGKGAWRSIAKNFVHTRTSTQVASHAQKYFSRQLDRRQRHKRSILDITSIPKTRELHQVTMCNSVDTNSQSQLNNVNQSRPSSMPLQPQPEMSCIQMAPNSLCQTIRGKTITGRASGDGDRDAPTQPS